MLEVHALTKYYGALPAVSELSFEVRPGEVMGLLGPNGAGKTTTLRCIAGILPPAGGRIAIAGHDLATEPLAAKRALAFIPDEPQFFDSLTVVEHLRFIGRVYEVEDSAGRTDVLLRQLELEEKRHVLPGELSRGMKQKLAMACALLHEPRVLMLDEPLTGLDPAAIRRVKRTILELAAGGAAVLLSSHLLSLVEELCSRILVMQQGRRVAIGSVAEIAASRPELQGRGLEDVFLSLTETGS